MSKKEKEPVPVTPYVPEKTGEQVKTEQFVAEYNGLCEKHGLAISAQLEYTQLGLVPKLIILRKDNESSK